MTVKGEKKLFKENPRGTKIDAKHGCISMYKQIRWESYEMTYLVLSFSIPRKIDYLSRLCEEYYVKSLC